MTEADIVSDILRRARELMPDVPVDRWIKIEEQLRTEYAGMRVYVGGTPSYRNEQIRSALLLGAPPDRVAAQFGVSTRTVWRQRAALRTLRKP